MPVCNLPHEGGVILLKVLRTPEERFGSLVDYPFTPHYCEVPDGEDGRLIIQYLDEGKGDAEPMLLMHGEPSWSYLYRKMIAIFVDAGYRVIAPDLIGFGRSDKPADRRDYIYNRHVTWMQAFLDQLDLQRITLLCQDWGGLIGLRLVAENPDAFRRVIAANTGLPTGDTPISDAFIAWREFSRQAPEFNVGSIIQGGCRTTLAPAVIAAYDAPFPDDSYK
jgi:haloalkane dehalogenase